MSANDRASKVRRIQELFVEGKVINLTAGDEVVRLFVAKPNSFDRDEATKDGRAGKARRVLTFDDDADEQAVLDDLVAETSRESKIRALVQVKDNDFYVRAMDDIRADKKWAERLEALDRAELADDSGTDEDARSRQAEEHETMRRVNTQYLAAVEAGIAKLREEEQTELEAKSAGDLDKAYRKAYRDQLGNTAFLSERRLSELYFAVRDCQGTEDATKPDGYDHSRCNGHVVRLADHRREVREFPDVVVITARTALEDLAMPPQDAAFSDAPMSSSASSGPHAEEEVSTASTPAETSPVPVGT